MITRVAIDAAALQDHQEQSRGAVNTHRSLLKVLESYGFLELLGPADANALFDAISGLSDEMRVLWVKAITSMGDLNRLRSGAWNDVTGDLCDAVPMPENLRSLVDLVVVREQISRDREPLRTNGFDTRADEPELALADSVAHCRTIERAQTLRDLGNYREGTQRDVIWTEVFAAPARVSTEATVLDKFFLEGLLNVQKRDSRDHAEWLIGNLDSSMTQGSTLRLLCRWPATDDKVRLPRPEIETNLRARIAPLVGSGRLCGISVILAPDRGLPHNRHLRFDSGVAISSEEGFDRLGHSEVRRVDGFSWRGITSATLLANLADRESVICSHPDRIEFNA